MEATRWFHQYSCCNLSWSIIDEAGTHRKKAFPPSPFIYGNRANVGIIASALYCCMGQQCVPLFANGVIVERFKYISGTRWHHKDDSTLCHRFSSMMKEVISQR